MKHILVCVKAVPAATSVQVDGEYRLKRDGVSLQWNIADESALEAALRLKDKDGTVTVTMNKAGRVNLRLTDSWRFAYEARMDLTLKFLNCGERQRLHEMNIPVSSINGWVHK